MSKDGRVTGSIPISIPKKAGAVTSVKPKFSLSSSGSSNDEDIDLCLNGKAQIRREKNRSDSYSPTLREGEYDNKKKNSKKNDRKAENGNDMDESDEDAKLEDDEEEFVLSSTPISDSVRDIFHDASPVSRDVAYQPRVRKQSCGEWCSLNQYLMNLSSGSLGHGSYGEVRIGLNKEENKEYAIKILNKNKLYQQTKMHQKATHGSNVACREIAILRKLSHPNVVKLIEVLDDPEGEYLYLVFELLPEGCVMPDLPTALTVNEKTARSYIRDVFLGLEYLHMNKICHRDLKPENMLKSKDGRIKIADFGLSGEFSGSDNMANPFGTPSFLPPECVGEEKCETSGCAMDIWAAGISLYAFLFGDVPFKGDSLMELFDNIRRQDLFKCTPNDKLKYVSKEAQLFLKRLLHKNPNQRLTMAEIRKDPWLTDGQSNPMPHQCPSCVIKISDEDVKHCVRVVPKVQELIMVKSRKFGRAIQSIGRFAMRRASGPTFANRPASNNSNSSSNSIREEDDDEGKCPLSSKRSSTKSSRESMENLNKINATDSLVTSAQSISKNLKDAVIHAKKEVVSKIAGPRK